MHVSPFGETVAMAFGQQSGPPAPARQVEELLALLREAGHTDFRDARGPMGLTQRQAAGKFTRDEAAAFIEQLQGTEPPKAAPAALPAEPAEAAPPSGLWTERKTLRDVPAEHLAAELRRRGWTATEPESR